MPQFVNRAGMTTATTGTGTLTLGAAITDATNGDYLNFDDAGVGNGRAVKYLITDGNNFELGQGIYTTTGTTLSRDTVTKSKSGATVGTAAISLSGSAKVYIVPHAEDQKWTRKSDGSSWNDDVDRSAGPQEAFGYNYNVVSKYGTAHTQYDPLAVYGANGGRVNRLGGWTWTDNTTLNASNDLSLYREAAGKMKITLGADDTSYGDLSLRNITIRPSASLTPATNGELVVEATSNTQITFKLKGSDGTVRSGSITLA
jgi:hypothetical protein